MQIPKRKRRATPSTAPKASSPLRSEDDEGDEDDEDDESEDHGEEEEDETSLPPPPTKVLESTVKQVADLKGKQRATPSAAPEASNPLRSELQSSQIARRKHRDLLEMGDTESNS